MSLRYAFGFIAMVSLWGCAEDKKDTNTAAGEKSKVSETSSGQRAEQPTPANVDRSRCDPSGKRVVEVDLNGDGKTDVRKYFTTAVEGGAKVDVLACKEVDENFDGKKDAWFYYDNAGQLMMEEYDFDFDGRVDMTAYRQAGKLVREELDMNFDGKTDIWKFYDNELLSRVEVSSKRNGRVDVWEYYEAGKLDRIGYDTTGSGQISRWDRSSEQSTAPQPPAPVAPQAPGAPPATAEPKK